MIMVLLVLYVCVIDFMNFIFMDNVIFIEMLLKKFKCFLCILYVFCWMLFMVIECLFFLVLWMNDWIGVDSELKWFFFMVVLCVLE